MSLTSSSAASTSDRLTTVLSYGALFLLIYLVLAVAWGGVDPAPPCAGLAGSGFFAATAPGRGKNRDVSGIAPGGAGEESVHLFRGLVHRDFRVVFHVPGWRGDRARGKPFAAI